MFLIRAKKEFQKAEASAIASWGSEAKAKDPFYEYYDEKNWDSPKVRKLQEDMVKWKKARQHISSVPKHCIALSRFIIPKGFKPTET